MSGTPTFVVTDAGLAAAAVASPTGPWISIVQFQIGTGYGYTPEPTDTGLSGELLYYATPTSYQNIGDGTLDILCTIPPNAGPFQFGEVALMLPGGVMFAKAVFPTAQNKFSALGTNVVSSYELHCLLTLAQGTAVFQVSTSSGPPTVLQVYSWDDVYPPGISANPTVPLIQVLELSEFGDSTILSNSSSTNWSIVSTYNRYSQVNDTATFTVANASTTWVEVLAADLHPNDLNAVSERFVIETSTGYFRSVSGVVTSGSNYRFNLNGTPLPAVPATGSVLQIYRDDLAGGGVYYSQIEDPLSYDVTNLANDTGTVNAYKATYKQKVTTLVNGLERWFVPTTVNTGASTFTLDTAPAAPIVGRGGNALQGGEVAGLCRIKYSSAASAWVLLDSTVGPMPIPNATQSQHALPLGQATALFTTPVQVGYRTGEVVFMATSSPPVGFLASNGALVSRTTYANLFSVIGTTFGAGDGLTTFQLPDMRGVSARGWDNGRGLDPSRAFGSYQADGYASHNHSVNDPGHSHGVNDPGHSHGVNDPGHSHGVNDPGHYHYTYPPNGIGNAGGGQSLTEQGTSKTNPTTQNSTNISINGADTNIGINGADTNIYLSAAGTNISIAASGITETRGKNVALLACIKY